MKSGTCRRCSGATRSSRPPPADPARKALSPAHFNDIDEVAERVLGFQHFAKQRGRLVPAA